MDKTGSELAGVRLVLCLFSAKSGCGDCVGPVPPVPGLFLRRPEGPAPLHHIYRLHETDCIGHEHAVLLSDLRPVVEADAIKMLGRK